MIDLLHSDVTGKIWRAYYNVYNAQGHDYPEAFFEEMMGIELKEQGTAYATQVPYEIYYKHVQVGKHITDMEVADCVVLEFKVKTQLLPRHQAQLISNLKVSGKPVGLLFNFGGLKAEGIRKVFTTQNGPFLPLWQPDNPDSNLLYPELTLALRHAMWEVYCHLGPGFVHRVYANAAAVELRLRQLPFIRLRKLDVLHRGQTVGQVAFRHFIIDDKLVLAPVTVSVISQSELNKVRAVMVQRGLRLGMIVNFQNEKLEVRFVR